MKDPELRQEGVLAQLARAKRELLAHPGAPPGWTTKTSFFGTIWPVVFAVWRDHTGTAKTAKPHDHGRAGERPPTTPAVPPKPTPAPKEAPPPTPGPPVPPQPAPTPPQTPGGTTSPPAAAPRPVRVRNRRKPAPDAPPADPAAGGDA